MPKLDTSVMLGTCENSGPPTTGDVQIFLRGYARYKYIHVKTIPYNYLLKILYLHHQAPLQNQNVWRLKRNFHPKYEKF